MVRKSDWDLAIDEHNKVRLLGPAAEEAYTHSKQVLIDAFPIQMEVSLSRKRKLVYGLNAPAVSFTNDS